MPAPDETTEQSGRPLLNVLFWAGVGVAPLAALLLLVAQTNGMLRIAAVLALLSVTLIGLSVALRSNPDTLRQDLEAMIFEEIDGLHKDVREDIATAARATHQAFGEKLQLLQAQVETLRGEGATAEGEMRGAPVRSGSAAAGFGREREPVARGYEPNFDATPEMPGVPFGGRASAPPVGAAVPPPAPGGVMRHPETVSTRHANAGSPVDGPAGGTVYGGAYGGSEWTPGMNPPAPDGGPGRAEWGERSWDHQRAGERWEDDAGRWSDSRGGPDGGRLDGPGGIDRGDQAGWSERAGDRWAPAQAGGPAREVRDEHRMAMRTDAAGSEPRAGDRWAALSEDRLAESYHREDGGGRASFWVGDDAELDAHRAGDPGAVDHQQTQVWRAPDGQGPQPHGGPGPEWGDGWRRQGGPQPAGGAVPRSQLPGGRQGRGEPDRRGGGMEYDHRAEAGAPRAEDDRPAGSGIYGRPAGRAERGPSGDRW